MKIKIMPRKAMLSNVVNSPWEAPMQLCISQQRLQQKIGQKAVYSVAIATICPPIFVSKSGEEKM